MLDEGSDTTLVREALVNRLGLKGGQQILNGYDQKINVAEGDNRSSRQGGGDHKTEGILGAEVLPSSS